MILYILQGKKGVWIKLPIELVNLVETAVKVISPYFFPNLNVILFMLR